MLRLEIQLSSQFKYKSEIQYPSITVFKNSWHNPKVGPITWAEKEGQLITGRVVWEAKKYLNFYYIVNSQGPYHSAVADFTAFWPSTQLIDKIWASFAFVAVKAEKEKIAKLIIRQTPWPEDTRKKNIGDSSEGKRKNCAGEDHYAAKSRPDWRAEQRQLIL
jgi:hypothetical protein